MYTVQVQVSTTVASRTPGYKNMGYSPIAYRKGFIDCIPFSETKAHPFYHTPNVL